MSTDTPDKPPIARFLGIREAKSGFSRMVKTAQSGTVVVMNHGRPAALIIGIEGVPTESIAAVRTMDELAILIKEHRSRAALTNVPGAKTSRRPRKRGPDTGR